MVTIVIWDIPHSRGWVGDIFTTAKWYILSEKFVSSHCISEGCEFSCDFSISRVISLKTSSGTPSKSAAEMWNAVTERVYSAGVDGLRSLLSKHKAHAAARQDKVEDFQTAFLDDVSCRGLHTLTACILCTHLCYWPTMLTFGNVSMLLSAIHICVSMYDRLDC